MIDEDVACLSSSTVYRILREAELMHRRPGRKKRYRDDQEKASRSNEIWGTDLMYLKVGGQTYYLITFIDEYSRYLVSWELLSSGMPEFIGPMVMRVRFAGTCAAGTQA
jgi:transposase InsO family protein